MNGADVVYFAPQQEYYPQTTDYEDARGPWHDLASVGTQFEDGVVSEYAQTF
jgi:hypothetical protein